MDFHTSGRHQLCWLASLIAMVGLCCGCIITAESESTSPVRIGRPLPIDQQKFSDYVHELIPEGTTFSEARSKLIGMGFGESEGEGRSRFNRYTVFSFGVDLIHYVVISHEGDTITHTSAYTGAIGL